MSDHVTATMGSADSGRDGEQYCLRWNDFQANVTGALSDIRDGEEFLDVTLVSEGKEVRAHKLILSSCSPLFRDADRSLRHLSVFFSWKVQGGPTEFYNGI